MIGCWWLIHDLRTRGITRLTIELFEKSGTFRGFATKIRDIHEIWPKTMESLFENKRICSEKIRDILEKSGIRQFLGKNPGQSRENKKSVKWLLGITKVAQWFIFVQGTWIRWQMICWFMYKKVVKSNKNHNWRIWNIQHLFHSAEHREDRFHWVEQCYTDSSLKR